jgi:hypothetical protein
MTVHRSAARPSASALGRAAVKRISTYGPRDESEIVAHLERLAGDRDHARRSLDLAVIQGRLVRTIGNTEPRLRLPGYAEEDAAR